MTQRVVGNNDARQALKDAENHPISAQFPLSADGDSVYAKDVDLVLSDIGNFTGTPTDFFNDYAGTNVAAAVGAGGVNPKSFKIVLERPVIASTIGIGSPNTSLSNAKLILRGLDGTALGFPGDYSTDNTKRGLVFFSFEQTAFIELEVFFYTDDEVTIGGMTIFKAQTVTIGAIDGLIPFAAQSVVPLLANDTWTSGIVDTKNYVWIIGSVYSDVASATDGFKFEFSSDKINWRWVAPYTIAAATAKTFSEQSQARYMRMTYTNGTTDQTVFDVTTKISPIPSKSSSHRLKDVLGGEDDCEAVKAGIMGFSDLTSLPENVSTFRGALSTSDGLRHKTGLSIKFHKGDSVSSTLAVQAVVGDTSITVASITGFAVNQTIEVYADRPTGELFFKITALPGGNVITLDQMVTTTLDIGHAVDVVLTEMNVLGSLTVPQIFYIGPPAGSVYQITRLIISMTDATAMDDGTFGGATALTNGVVVRQFANGIYESSTIWRNNAAIANDMYDFTYVPKPPAGTGYGARGRWTFTAMEAVVELNGDTNDQLQIVIQDDLTVLNSFSMKAQGRLFGG